jgi:hypothetical protein
MPGCNGPCKCPTFKEHIQTIGTLTHGRSDWHKTTVHKTGDESSVEVTEHFDGRQDVTVKPGVIRMKASISEIGASQ